MLINKTYIDEDIIAKMNFIHERPDLGFKSHLAIVTIYGKRIQVGGKEEDFYKTVSYLEERRKRSNGYGKK